MDGFCRYIESIGGRKIIKKKTRWKIEKIRWKKSCVLSHCKISYLSQIIVPSQFHS